MENLFNGLLKSLEEDIIKWVTYTGSIMKNVTFESNSARSKFVNEIIHINFHGLHNIAKENNTF